jgi:hypothetical protein
MNVFNEANSALKIIKMVDFMLCISLQSKKFFKCQSLCSTFLHAIHLFIHALNRLFKYFLSAYYALWQVIEIQRKTRQSWTRQADIYPSKCYKLWETLYTRDLEGVTKAKDHNMWEDQKKERKKSSSVLLAESLKEQQVCIMKMITWPHSPLAQS